MTDYRNREPTPRPITRTISVTPDRAAIWGSVASELSGVKFHQFDLEDGAERSAAASGFDKLSDIILAGGNAAVDLAVMKGNEVIQITGLPEDLSLLRQGVEAEAAKLADNGK